VQRVANPSEDQLNTASVGRKPPTPQDAPSLCPADGEWARLLADGPTEQESERLAEHINRCPRCLARVVAAQQSIQLPGIVDDRDRTGSGPVIDPDAPGDVANEFDTSGVEAAVRAALRDVAEETGDRVEVALSPVSSDGEAGDHAASAVPTPLVMPDAETIIDEGTTADDPEWRSEMLNGTVPHDEHTVVLGGYRLTRLIGQGGMGDVFEALSTDGFNRRVAVKRLRGDRLDDVRTGALIREIDILSAIQHPNIVHVISAGREADGRPFLVTELVDGQSLDRWCDERRLPIEERLWLFCKVCEGVAACHERAVVHRDLKPGNVLVDQSGCVKILDFGLARALEPVSQRTQYETRTGVRILTPGFASPEQLRGEKLLGPATDIYSLGVMLYHLLSGTAPVAASSGNGGDVEVSPAVAGVRPVSMSSRLRGLSQSGLVGSDSQESGLDQPIADATAEQRGTTSRKLIRQLRGDLDRIVQKAMDPRPGLQPGDGRRYSSVPMLIEDLKRFLDGRVVQPEERTATYRLRAVVRMHWKALLVLSVFITTILAALGVTTVLLKQSRDALAETRDANERNLTTLERYLDTLMDDAVLGEERMAGLRTRLLTDAASLYEAALSKSAESERSSLRVAEGWTRLGMIHLETDSPMAAEKAFDWALAIHSQLETIALESLQLDLSAWTIGHAEALRGRAVARSRLGRDEPAEADIQQALVMMDGFNAVLEAPQHDVVLHRLLETQWQILFRQRKFNPAVDVAKGLVDQDRDYWERLGTDEARFQLAESLGRVALTLHKDYTPADAVPVYEEALKLIGLDRDIIVSVEELLASESSEDLSRQAATLLANQGMSLLTVGRIDDAWQSHLAARLLRERLVERYPLRIEDRAGLMGTLWDLADVLLTRRDRAAEVELRRECLQEVESLLKIAPHDQRYLTALCVNSPRLSDALWQTGSRRQAIDEFVALLKRGIRPEEVEYWNNRQQILVAGLRLQAATGGECEHQALPGSSDDSGADAVPCAECVNKVVDRLELLRERTTFDGELTVEMLTSPDRMFAPLHDHPRFRAVTQDIARDE
jgi:serine/threonine protein kinase/tetratricopeptide (TPR) repeat protein